MSLAHVSCRVSRLTFVRLHDQISGCETLRDVTDGASEYADGSHLILDLYSYGELKRISAQRMSGVLEGASDPLRVTSGGFHILLIIRVRVSLWRKLVASVIRHADRSNLLSLAHNLTNNMSAKMWREAARASSGMKTIRSQVVCLSSGRLDEGVFASQTPGGHIIT